MLFKPLLSSLLCSGGVAAQVYSLQSSFSGPTFFDNFDFWTAPDPTIGYVHYVDRATAEQNGMISYSDPVSWGVETSQVLNPLANLGRLSLRLTSKRSWTHGLFLLDLAHMPSNQCGVWPAFWSLGSGQWPSNGEIDIIEFANTLPDNIIAAHTTPGCSIAGAGQSGKLLTNDCNEADGYTGCGVSVSSPNNVGDAFNAEGGGLYAMEWTSTAIKVWFIPRPSIINLNLALTTGTLDIALLGKPQANFQGSCDIDRFFFNHSLVFDLDFCGTYAGNTWQGAGCPMSNPSNGWASCNEFVALNPGAFTAARWEVNFLNVYQISGGSIPSSSSLSSSMPVASTSSVASAAMNAEGRSTTPKATPKSDIATSNTMLQSTLNTIVSSEQTVPMPAPTPAPDQAGVVTVVVVEVVIITTVVI